MYILDSRGYGYNGILAGRQLRMQDQPVRGRDGVYRRDPGKILEQVRKSVEIPDQERIL